jgi:thiol-activated cytolysin
MNPTTKTLALFSLSFLFTGCASREAEAIDEYIRSLGRLELPAPASVEKTGQPVQEGNSSCTATQHTETRHFTEVSALDIDGELFPGQILHGAPVFSHEYNEAPFERSPLTFSVSLPLNGPTSATMKNPNIAEFRTERDQLLSVGMSGVTQAKISSEVSTFESLEQLSLTLGVDVTSNSFNLDSDFSLNQVDQRSHAVVKFVQEFYTVDIVPPSNPSDFFGRGVTLAEVQSKFDDGNPPMYVKSVTYGRVIYFFVESSFSSSELEAALNLSFNGNTDVTVTGDLKASDIVSQSTVRALIVGGDAQAATEAIQDGLEGIERLKVEGATFSPENPGLPIAYQLAYVSDNAQASTFLSQSFALKACELVSVPVLVKLMNIRVEGSGAFELFGTISAFGSENTEVLFNQTSEQFVRISEEAPLQLEEGGSLGQGRVKVNPQTGSELHIRLNLSDFDPIGSNDSLSTDVKNFSINLLADPTEEEIIVPAGSSRIILKLRFEPSF